MWFDRLSSDCELQRNDAVAFKPQRMINPTQLKRTCEAYAQEFGGTKVYLDQVVYTFCCRYFQFQAHPNKPECGVQNSKYTYAQPLTIATDEILE